MRWFKLEDKVFAFDDDQLDLVEPEMVEMTEEEIDRHSNPRNYWTTEQLEAERLSSYKTLTRRQFMRSLVLNGIDLDYVEAQINLIENAQIRQLTLIDWRDSTEFTRVDETLLLMAGMLGLTSEQVDQMWEFGLTL